MSICSTGSPKLAREWAAALDRYSDVEAARAADENIWGKRFPDNEWVFGMSQNSHGAPRTGGTLVVKDSRHGVRVFFGHVCGGPGPTWWHYNFENVKSLDLFYAGLHEHGFTEYNLPAE